MQQYGKTLKAKIIELRSQGLTYSEIQAEVKHPVPKSSLSYICRNVRLDETMQQRIRKLSSSNSKLAQQKAVLANKKIFDARLAEYRESNEHLAGFMKDRRAQQVALALLYLGEGAKWQGSRAPRLGSSDPMIIRLYIDLLRVCYDIDVSKLRGRIQCRADQDQAELLKFWAKVTGIQASRFYPTYVDRRTTGKVTSKQSYKGVCAISCAGTHIQLELAEISSIIGRALRGH